MKAFIYWWGREDILFASAVLPAAMAWIAYESTLMGVMVFVASYAVIVAAYEYLATRRNWPHAAVVAALKEVSRLYAPQD
ncbi:MAG: hypothetical protein WA021_00410 [Minisyncoccia bacterium]